MADFSRTKSLIGNEKFNKLQKSSVIIFGIGGVGSFVAEALVRAGIGKITIIDNDVVDKTNINRQLIALNSTIGLPKVEVMKKRILDINPDCKVRAIQTFYDGNSNILLDCDYIVDAIDSVLSKLVLIEKSVEQKIPIISSMGTGNKINPAMLEIADISKTSVCPLAKKMRIELRKKGINHLKVLFSKEIPIVRSVPPSSISFVPSSAGLLIASEVVRDLIS